jgi:hypothetical protein
MDAANGLFWTVREKETADNKEEYVALDDTDAKRRQLPTGVTLAKPKARYDKESKAFFVAFYPSGACDYARVTLKSGSDLTISIDTKGHIGQFEVKEK